MSNGNLLCAWDLKPTRAKGLLDHGNIMFWKIVSMQKRDLLKVLLQARQVTSGETRGPEKR
eukprot:5566027-Pyramimonas_sp.AAC.1